MALSDTWGVGWGGLLQLNLREATSPPGPRRKGTNTYPALHAATAGRPLSHGPAEKLPEAEARGLVHQGAELHVGAQDARVRVRRRGLPVVSAAPARGAGRPRLRALVSAPGHCVRPPPQQGAFRTPGRVCEPPPVGGEAGTSCGHSGHEPCPAGPCPPPRDAAASPDHAPARLTAACGARCPQENVPVPDLARGLWPSGSPPRPALPLASPLTLTAQPPPPVSPCTSLEGAGHPCSGPPLASPGCPCSSFAIRLTTSRRPSRTLGLGSVRSCEFPESPWLPAHLEHDCGLSGPSPLGQGCVDLPLCPLREAPAPVCLQSPVLCPPQRLRL